MGISEEESLLKYRLAPLKLRRDIGMLGVIQRSVIGEGPHQFNKFFVRKAAPSRPHGREAVRRHDKQLETHRNGRFLDIMSKSVLGLVDIYNLVPQFIVNATTVSEFQKRLQILTMELAETGTPGWQDLYSPRNTIWNHKLREMQDWSRRTQK